MSRMFVCHQPTNDDWYEGNIMEGKARRKAGLPLKHLTWPPDRSSPPASAFN